jgi:hypothetical protein
MPYLIIRSDVTDADATTDQQRFRDERFEPETHRQTATADSLDAAMRMARALSACGQVRTGRQKVTVVRIPAPDITIE